jgi:hypothetical protein
MRLSLFALVFAAVAFPRLARANDPAAAQVLFNQAREAVRSGDYAAACPMFEESQRLDPAIGTKFNLADCYEHEGRTASAWALFLEVAAATKIASQGARELEARARAAALAPRLSTLVVAPPSSKIDGLEVKRDGGESLGPTQWGMPMPIDPGRHTFVASAPGHLPWQTTVEIAAGARRVSLTIPALKPVPAPETPAASPADDASHTDESPPSNGLGAQRAAALVTGAVGVVGLGVGSVFGLVSVSKHGASDQGCNSQSVCSTSAAATRMDAIHAGNVSTVAFAIGAVAVATGVVLWVTAPTGSAKVGLAPLPTGAAMVGTW